MPYRHMRFQEKTALDQTEFIYINYNFNLLRIIWKDEDV